MELLSSNTSHSTKKWKIYLRQKKIVKDLVSLFILTRHLH